MIHTHTHKKLGCIIDYREGYEKRIFEVNTRKHAGNSVYLFPRCVHSYHSNALNNNNNTNEKSLTTKTLVGNFTQTRDSPRKFFILPGWF